MTGVRTPISSGRRARSSPSARFPSSSSAARASVAPSRRDAFEILEVATLVDAALDALINTATRYFDARADAAWPAIQAEMVLRAQTALDALAARIGKLDRDTIGAGGWSGADMWLYTGVTWLASLPGRATDPNAHANIKQLMTLPFTLPPVLVAWADRQRSRPDVATHGG